MGLKSRNKGKVGERAACEVLRPLFPDVRRRAMQARGGNEGADLENTPGYHVEVGVGNVNPATKWEQAFDDWLTGRAGGQNDVPIALTRRDRGTWIVTMNADHFRTLETLAREGRAQRAIDHQQRKLTTAAVADLDDEIPLDAKNVRKVTTPDFLNDASEYKPKEPSDGRALLRRMQATNREFAKDNPGWAASITGDARIATFGPDYDPKAKVE